MDQRLSGISTPNSLNVVHSLVTTLFSMTQCVMPQRLVSARRLAVAAIAATRAIEAPADGDQEAEAAAGMIVRARGSKGEARRGC